MNRDVLPEFQELHQVYERAIDVRDALLRDAPANIGRELYGELVGRYSSLAIEISALLVFLRSSVKDFDADLYKLWLEASKAPGLPPAA